MGWHDDEFPDENTDPGLAQPKPVQVPQHQQHQQHQQGYPQSGGMPMTGQFAPAQQPGQQMPGHQPHPSGGYPQQPAPHAGYPQQQQRPTTGGHAQQPPSTGGYPQQQGPNTGGYPAQQGPNTGGYPAPPPPSGMVPIIPAPIVAIEEEAKASRVVYGLSGTAAGGIIGVILGVLNTMLEGQTITEGTGFIFDCAIWFAFILGVVAFWKPERFDYAIMRWTKDDDEE